MLGFLEINNAVLSDPWLVGCTSSTGFLIL